MNGSIVSRLRSLCAKALALSCMAVMVGCATSSPIERHSESTSNFSSEPSLMEHSYPDDDIYQIYHRAATGYVSIETIRQSAERRIDAFAERHQKRPVILGEKSSNPPFILGNFPRIEIVFALADKDESEVSGDTRSERYQLLREAQSLYEEGLLSEEEFERERERILNE